MAFIQQQVCENITAAMAAGSIIPIVGNDSAPVE